MSVRERVNEGRERRGRAGAEEMGKRRGDEAATGRGYVGQRGVLKGERTVRRSISCPAPRCMLPGQTLCRLWYLSGKFSPQAHLSSRRGELSRRGSRSQEVSL